MNITIILILIAVAFAVGVFLFMRKSKQKVIESNDQRLMLDMVNSLEYRTLTEGQPEIWSYRELSPGEMQTIRNAFDTCERIATHYGYDGSSGRANVARAACTVCVVPSIRDYNADGVYSPSFKVPISTSNPWYNTDYMKLDERGNPYILAAERVLDQSIEGNRMNRWLVASSPLNLQYFSDAVINGFEHCLLFHCDLDRFAATVGTDHTHPILPLPIKS